MASSMIEICDLPDEVLCYIFTKLNVEQVIMCVMNVCHRWRSVVAENKLFWDNLQLVVDCDFFFGQSYLDEETARRPRRNIRMPDGSLIKEIFLGEKDLEKVPKLRSIKFTEVNKIIEHSLSCMMEIMSKTCKDIEKVEFSLSFGSISRSIVRLLSESFNNIKEIWFCVNGPFYPLYDVPYKEISRFYNLNTLVSHSKKITSSDLYLLAEGCEHLNSLWILFCEHLEINDVLYFLDKKKSTLKELGLGINLQDCVLDKLNECHNLEVFFASDARNVTDICVKSFASQSSLKYCSLHNAKFLQSTVLDIAGPLRKPGVFKHLEILDLTGYYHYEEPNNFSLKVVHKQEEGIIVAVCATGSSSRDSLLSWVRLLQRNNPRLGEIPILFTLKSPVGPTEPLQEIEGDEPLPVVNTENTSKGSEK